MTIDRHTIPQLAALVISTLKPLLLLAGVVLAAAIAIGTLVMPLPMIDGSQTQMLLAALLVFAGR